MSQIDLDGDARVMALSIAAHAALLEDRIAFADAILPLVERCAPNFKPLGYVTNLLPQGLPAAQWIALAEDHLAFLLPAFPYTAPVGGIAGVKADLARWSGGATPV